MPAPRPPARAYDARARRERALLERGQTRVRVVAAAGELFASTGYSATTITAVAERAGVAVQSIYTAVGGKPALLMAAERAVLRGGEDVPVVEQDWVAAMAGLPDPHDQLARLAHQVRRIAERAVPLWIAVREAAATDPEIASHLAAGQAARRESFARFARAIAAEHLRAGMTHMDAADAMWTVASPEVSILLRRDRGWSFDRIERWQRDAMERLVLV